MDTTGNITLSTSTGTTHLNQWTMPTLIKTEEVGETVEFIYKQTSLVSYTTYPPIEPPARVFKIVFSCKDGKWHKSEPIYGTIIPATEESYEFD